jgi:hypothetical protein
MFRNRTTACALLLLTLALPSAAISQQPSSSRIAASGNCTKCENITPFDNSEGLHVTMVVKESFAKADVDAVVRIRSGPSGSTIVGFRRSAITPELVYDALTSVASIRTRSHGAPPDRATAHILASNHRRPIPIADRDWIADIVSQLAYAKQTNVLGVGSVPVINITIDSKKAHKT